MCSLNERKKTLHNLMWSYGGPEQFMKFIRKALGDKSIRYQTVINWKNRGSIPIVKALLIADALRIDPLLLNYKDVSKLKNCSYYINLK